MSEFIEQKQKLADLYLQAKYAGNQKIVDAFLKVPRESFVLSSDSYRAYQDTPLPLMKGQTISAPHMCILILTYGKFEPGQLVLEIGIGSGYQSALIAELIGPTGHVYGIELVDELAEFGMRNLEKTGYSNNVTIIAGDGTMGWPEAENIPPFDRIVITAAGPQVPPPLIKQLKIGGYLYMPLGQPGRSQEWIQVEKISSEEIRQRTLTTVLFVPLLGEYGNPE